MQQQPVERFDPTSGRVTAVLVLVLAGVVVVAGTVDPGSVPAAGARRCGAGRGARLGLHAASRAVGHAPSTSSCATCSRRSTCPLAAIEQLAVRQVLALGRGTSATSPRSSGGRCARRCVPPGSGSAPAGRGAGPGPALRRLRRAAAPPADGGGPHERRACESLSDEQLGPGRGRTPGAGLGADRPDRALGRRPSWRRCSSDTGVWPWTRCAHARVRPLSSLVLRPAAWRPAPGAAPRRGRAGGTATLVGTSAAGPPRAWPGGRHGHGATSRRGGLPRVSVPGLDGAQRRSRAASWVAPAARAGPRCAGACCSARWTLRRGLAVLPAALHAGRPPGPRDRRGGRAILGADVPGTYRRSHVGQAGGAPLRVRRTRRRALRQLTILADAHPDRPPRACPTWVRTAHDLTYVGPVGGAGRREVVTASPPSLPVTGAGTPRTQPRSARVEHRDP